MLFLVCFTICFCRRFSNSRKYTEIQRNETDSSSESEEVFDRRKQTRDRRRHDV